jgi:putative transposase
VRSAAAENKISKSSVHRYFQLFGVKPHLTESFKLSTDAFFVEKLRDVVGLYLNPPDNALVLSVDEKSQCQALERTQPMLPLGLGVRRRRHPRLQTPRHHDAVCRPGCAGWLGHCAMQAAPPASGISRLPAHHRGERTEDLDIHRIVDNYSTHKHARVKAWLAARPRWHIHFTPTYSSWLNQVERFFGLITDKAIRRGSFRTVKELVSQIDHFISQYNKNCKPFVWTATAESILAKLERLTSRICGTAH